MHWVQLTDAWHAFFHAPETCAPQVMNLQLFGWIMIAGLLLFLPPETISRWLEWLAAWM